MPGQIKPKASELLIESLRQAVEIRQGRRRAAKLNRVRVTARDVQVAEPRGCGARKVRSIRERLRLSQAVFARALNVSAATVRAWEQSSRVPDGPSLRLLEIADRHPEILLESIR